MISHVAQLRTTGSTPSRHAHVAFEFKLEEIVGDFGSALTRKHKHLVPAHGYGKVATGWRNLTTLIDLKKPTGREGNVKTSCNGCTLLLDTEMHCTGLLPTCMLTILEADGPHVVQPVHRGKHVKGMCNIQLYNYIV